MDGFPVQRQILCRKKLLGRKKLGDGVLGIKGLANKTIDVHHFMGFKENIVQVLIFIRDQADPILFQERFRAFHFTFVVNLVLVRNDGVSSRVVFLEWIFFQ